MRTHPFSAAVGLSSQPDSGTKRANSGASVKICNSSVVKIRVLVVDDAVVVRRLVSDVIAADPVLEVAGTAANGRIALAKIPQVNPDVVTLDVEMPEMDGL